VDIPTVLCGLLAAVAALPALDATLRLRRLTRVPGAPGRGVRPARLLVLVPARAEGARVGDLAEDLRKEGERKREPEKEISSKVKSAADAKARAGFFRVDVLVLLDGPDPDAEARLKADGVRYLSKKSPGPSKGHALAFLAEHLSSEIDACDFVLVFDADMRLPEGFFCDLTVPEGADVFQLPVRPSGVPAPGAPRVEALSLAAARADDLARDVEGLPVRLRGKAMGFSPRAFRLGPAASTRTTVEDSEATLRLSASGIRVRALEAPVAFDEPVSSTRAMSGSRARWLGGHLRLLFTGFADLLKIAARSPKGAFVLAADLWLRPRLFVLSVLAFLAIVSDVVLLYFSSKGTWASLGSSTIGAASGAGAIATPRPAALLVFLLLLSLEAKTTLVFEWLLLAAVRRHIGYPSEIPAVTLSDLLSSLAMWVRAAGRAMLAPSRWHRARPPA
jgi:cellulose synthase/poly-beta-1,6-N-acetylglucosamine synthase-like glycosyltransferase